MWLRRLTSGFSSEKCTSTPLPASLTLNKRNPGDFPGFQCPDNSQGAFAVDSRFALAPIPPVSHAPRSAAREVPREGKTTASSPPAWAWARAEEQLPPEEPLLGTAAVPQKQNPHPQPPVAPSPVSVPRWQPCSDAVLRLGCDFQRDEPGLDLPRPL